MTKKTQQTQTDHNTSTKSPLDEGSSRSFYNNTPSKEAASTSPCALHASLRDSPRACRSPSASGVGSKSHSAEDPWAFPPAGWEIWAVEQRMCPDSNNWDRSCLAGQLWECFHSLQKGKSFKGVSIALQHQAGFNLHQHRKVSLGPTQESFNKALRVLLKHSHPLNNNCTQELSNKPGNLLC